MTGDTAADIQNLRSYYTEGQAFFRSSEASNLNSYYTWRRTIRGDIRYPLEIVSHYCDPSLKLDKNYMYKYMCSLNQNIGQTSKFNAHLDRLYIHGSELLWNLLFQYFSRFCIFSQFQYIDSSHIVKFLISIFFLFVQHLFSLEQRDHLISTIQNRAANCVGLSIKQRKDPITFDQFQEHRLGKYR